MSNAFALALLLPTLVAGVPAAPPKDGPRTAKTKLALLPFTAGPGVEEAVAKAIAEPTASEIRRVPSLQLITEQEIVTLLGYERERALLSCQADSCLAEIGGALGVDHLAQGTLSKLGESWLVTLKLIEVRKVRVLAQSDRRLRKGTIDDVLDVLPQMVGELLAPLGVSPPEAAKAAAEPRPNLVFIELLGNGVLSINYERTLVGVGESVDFGARLGLGVGVIGMVDFSVGTPHHRLEVGVGASKIVALPLTATGTIGYRYLSDSGFLFRLGLTPLISMADEPVAITDGTEYSWFPLFGTSFGWAF